MPQDESAAREIDGQQDREPRVPYVQESLRSEVVRNEAPRGMSRDLCEEEVSG